MVETTTSVIIDLYIKKITQLKKIRYISEGANIALH